MCEYIYNSTYEKEGNPAICDNMDGPGRLYVKWSKSDKKGHAVWNHLYMESKKAKLIKAD